jgi:hypothetical protein
MKKILLVASIAVFAIACKSKKSDDTIVLSATKDSAEYSKYLKFKEEEAAKALKKEEPKTVVVYKTVPATEAAPAKKKKGWSKAAKGAVIGGASGAVIGAVVNKRNRGAGAVVGGVVGAGVGYGIGRSKDKKDGR